jgi:hypothetical protein
MKNFGSEEKHLPQVSKDERHLYCTEEKHLAEFCPSMTKSWQC